MIATPYACRGCGQPSAEPLHWGCDAATLEQRLLLRPGVMRATWPSTCPCGSPIAVGDVVGLADTPTGRAWVCRACLTPDPTPTVPEPRAGETTLEVAR